MTVYHMDAQGKVLRVIDDAVSYDRSSMVVRGMSGARRILGCDTAAGEYFSPTPEPPAPPAGGADVDTALDIVGGVI